MENTVIKQVIETKNWFPGAFIDHHLSWKPHIGLKKSQISWGFSSKMLLTSYYSLVYSYLTYCNVAWSAT